LLLIFPMLVV